MENKVAYAYNQYLDINMIDDSAQSYAEFATTNCTACGELKSFEDMTCRCCDGTGGFSYGEILTYRVNQARS